MIKIEVKETSQGDLFRECRINDCMVGSYECYKCGFNDHSSKDEYVVNCNAPCQHFSYEREIQDDRSYNLCNDCGKKFNK